ncbi:lysine--tRNA ligase [Candidatus Woesearchaeota archaeon]|nr:lysine--tRNA ligase [Candidatus Woesearchaeota archaeon]
MQWADVVARRVIELRGDKKKYTVAAGITPSGVVHIGNFREIITVDLVARALRNIGKEVRFIYSWDDYDVFRKVPKNMPNPEELEKFLRMPITETPDPWGCHKSYAEHNEKAVEDVLPEVGIAPEFIRQNEMYKACKYAEQMREALRAREKIREILDKYRQEPLKKEWLPLSAYCPKCKKDEVSISEYDEEYSVRIKCKCGYDEKVDIRKSGFVKLPWRVDWPMRWHYEQVDFEPGGKDHSTPGGSRDTGEQIQKAVWGDMPPIYQMYDFVTIKGKGGKISSSLGNVITLREVLDIYEPAIARYLFCGTRPNREFAISFDLDVLKIYSDFDRVEQAYYGKSDVEDKKKLASMKRTYELCAVDGVPEKMPVQLPFRHLVNVIQICEGNVTDAVEYFKDMIKDEADMKRAVLRATCIKNWLEKYAPDEFRFVVQKKLPAGIKLADNEKKALKQAAGKLREKKWQEEELFNEFYSIITENGLKPADFFRACYFVLLNKERGPKLVPFILTLGQEKVASLFDQV